MYSWLFINSVSGLDQAGLANAMKEIEPIPKCNRVSAIALDSFNVILSPTISSSWVFHFRQSNWKNIIPVYVS
jgi:hypothetical protein